MPIDESRLRHRRERLIFFVSVLINLALMGLALYLVTYGADWLKQFPRLAERAENVRGLALAAVLAIPTLPLVRNLRRAHVRGHSIQVSSSQLPNIHAKLVQQCGMLGMRVPELYLSDEAIKEDARGYTAWKCDYIVLSTKYLDRDLQGSREVIAFLLGREVGRIRLGQAAWWDEMLLAYIVLVPVLRRPLRRIRAYSRDRYGAVLAPEGFKGVLVQAAGRRVLPDVDLEAYVAELRQPEGFWAKLSELTSEEPHVSNRLHALLEAGLLQLPVSPTAPLHGKD